MWQLLTTVANPEHGTRSDALIEMNDIVANKFISVDQATNYVTEALSKDRGACLFQNKDDKYSLRKLITRLTTTTVETLPSYDSQLGALVDPSMEETLWAGTYNFCGAVANVNAAYIAQ